MGGAPTHAGAQPHPPFPPLPLTLVDPPLRDELGVPGRSTFCLDGCPPDEAAGLGGSDSSSSSTLSSTDSASLSSAGSSRDRLRLLSPCLGGDTPWGWDWGGERREGGSRVERKGTRHLQVCFGGSLPRFAPLLLRLPGAAWETWQGKPLMALSCPALQPCWAAVERPVDWTTPGGGGRREEEEEALVQQG